MIMPNEPTLVKPAAASAVPTTPAPAPIDPQVQARTLVESFAREAKLTPDLQKRLQDLVVAAIDERFAEAQDIRLGRVLGSALATL